MTFRKSQSWLKRVARTALEPGLVPDQSMFQVSSSFEMQCFPTTAGQPIPDNTGETFAHCSCLMKSNNFYHIASCGHGSEVEMGEGEEVLLLIRDRSLLSLPPPPTPTGHSIWTCSHSANWASAAASPILHRHKALGPILDRGKRKARIVKGEKKSSKYRGKGSRGAGERESEMR